MPAPPSGRIITFYSYKGGTGRSMALANVAWILASSGKRVLVIDWDLEAPGLHRYFHPFLRDKDLAYTEGVIDFVVDFAAAALTATGTRGENEPDQEWYVPHANLLRYATSLDWDLFPPPGTLDFVPAGRQDAGYAVRVNSFNWQHFYEELGGGLFLEAAKKRMREEYDFVLIDSRTGVGDTSGICTVQMPDQLVVCFLLNTQSIEGAAAVASSVVAQRRTEGGESGLRVWPIPMRVEMAERRRLDSARAAARAKFDPFLVGMSMKRREEYWRSMEVLYLPFFAYEEVLATFCDRPGQAHSMLASIELITGYLTDGTVTRMGEIPEPKREQVLGQYMPSAEPPLMPMPSCEISAQPVFVRGEGRTELVSDIILTFASEAPLSIAAASPRFNIQIFLSTNVTNRAEFGSVTDAAFLPELNSAGSLMATKARGVVVGDNSLLFQNLQLDWPAGTTTRKFRITGVRVNANQAFSQGDTFMPQAITAYVTIVSSRPIVVAKPSVVVALVRKSLEFRVEGGSHPGEVPFVFSRLRGVNQEFIDDPIGSEGVINFRLHFGEGYAEVFKDRSREAGLGGTADNGTRFLARFSNIPSGVEIFVTAKSLILGGAQPEGPRARALLVPADPTGAGGDALRPVFGMVSWGRTRSGVAAARLGIVGGFAYAVWEWMREESDVLRGAEQVTFGVVVAARAGQAALGRCLVSGSLAPVSSDHKAGESSPVPRFADVSITVEAFSVV